MRTCLMTCIHLGLIATCAFGSTARAADARDAAHADRAANAYSCDLRAKEGLCREYHVVADLARQSRTLANNCAAMGGAFRTGNACPTQGRVARCADVAPDPNVFDRLSQTYDVHYYRGGSGDWNRDTVRRVCVNLIGVYAAD